MVCFWLKNHIHNQNPTYIIIQTLAVFYRYSLPKDIQAIFYIFRMTNTIYTCIFFTMMLADDKDSILGMEH